MGPHMGSVLISPFPLVLTGQCWCHAVGLGGGKSNEDHMGSHMGSVLVSPFLLEANGNRNGVMDGQNQIPNVVKVGSVGRHTGKHTETSLFLSSARAKAWQRANQRKGRPWRAPTSRRHPLLIS